MGRPKKVTDTAKEVKTEAVVEETAQEEAVVEEVAPEVINEPEAKSTSKSVTVTWRGNTRVYSLDVHGKDYRKLAEAFATKFEGTIE